MRIIRTSVRFLLILALSFLLGGAAIARISHEAQAPAKVYLSGEGSGVSIVKLCDSKSLLDHQGTPVNIKHIHACGACVIADATVISFDPINPIAFVLAPEKTPAYFPEPIADWATVPPAAPALSHAPPFFS